MLKDARDHSRLTRKTPIISAGMISAPNGEKLSDNKSEDMVGLPATMTFLRANGLDSLVDGCGIHTYPSSDHPDDPAAARRTARFETDRFIPPRGSAKGEALLVYRMGFPEQRLFVSVEGLGPDARGSEKADEFCQSSRGASAGGYRLLGVEL